MTQHYEIRINGHLDLSWADWFDGMSIHHDDNGETLISGKLIDQSALHGVLRKISDLGVSLISVNAVANLSPDDQQNKE